MFFCKEVAPRYPFAAGASRPEDARAHNDTNIREVEGEMLRKTRICYSCIIFR